MKINWDQFYNITDRIWARTAQMIGVYFMFQRRWLLAAAWISLSVLEDIYRVLSRRVATPAPPKKDT